MMIDYGAMWRTMVVTMVTNDGNGEDGGGCDDEGNIIVTMTIPMARRMVNIVRGR